MDFRKVTGTRDAIFQLRMINERVTPMNREKDIQGRSAKRKNYIYASWIIRKLLIE